MNINNQNINMSLPDLNTFSEKFDFLNAIFQQGNACPICHLPLVFSNTFHGSRRSADNLWMKCVQKMKAGIMNNTNLYGDIGTPAAMKSNAEKCHYVSKTMVTEVSKPFLMECPVIGQTLTPELNLYLRPLLLRDAQYRLFRYDFDNLLTTTNQRRINKTNSLFNLSCTRFFYGCKDCNAVHTGHHQLRVIANDTYQLHLADNQNGNPNCVNLYTLLFDSMAVCDGGINRVAVDENLCNTWSIRLWINYCTIMFMAQNEASNNRTKLVVPYRIQRQIYYFHYAHRDMGLCDSYISQIIGAFLYANYDVELDFMFLHQNFFVRIPLWAQTETLFVTPPSGYRSFWRMVIGCDVNDQNLLPVCTDLGMAAGNNSYQTGHNFYWLTNNQTIEVRIGHFVKTWVKVIGKLMQLHSLHDNFDAVLQAIPQEFATQQEQIKNLYRLYYLKCARHYMLYKTIIGFRNGPNSFFELMAQNPTMDTVIKCFKSVKPDLKLMYNFIKITISRHNSIIVSYPARLGAGGDPPEQKIQDKFTCLRDLTIEIHNI